MTLRTVSGVLAPFWASWGVVKVEAKVKKGVKAKLVKQIGESPKNVYDATNIVLGEVHNWDINGFDGFNGLMLVLLIAKLKKRGFPIN